MSGRKAEEPREEDPSKYQSPETQRPKPTEWQKTLAERRVKTKLAAEALERKRGHLEGNLYDLAGWQRRLGLPVSFSSVTRGQILRDLKTTKRFEEKNEVNLFPTLHFRSQGVQADESANPDRSGGEGSSAPARGHAQDAEQ